MNRSAKPWVIDAKDIEPVDVSSFSDHLFYTSTQIDRFVRGKGANIHLVSGPKGVGKTLVLKLKRHSLQGSSTRLIPDNQLLDKFIGVPYIFSLKEMKDLLETE